MRKLLRFLEMFVPKEPTHDHLSAIDTKKFYAAIHGTVSDCKCQHSLDKCDCSNVVAHLTQNNNLNQCNRLSDVTKVKSTGMSQNCARQLNCVVGRSDWPDKALPASKMFVARFLNKKFWTQYSILRKTLQNIWDEYRVIPMIGFKNVYH